MMNTYTSTSVSRLLLAVALIGLMGHASAQDSRQSTHTISAASSTSPAASLGAQDWSALRAWFHRPEFNVSDQLNTYAEDYRGLSTAGYMISCGACLNEARDGCANAEQVRTAPRCTSLAGSM